MRAGEWLIFKPPKPIILSRLQFYARNDDIINGLSSNRVPGKFKVYGSPDGTTWTQILDYTATKLVYPAGSFTGVVNVPLTRGYAYIGVVISSLAAANVETDVLQINELVIHGLPASPCIQVCTSMNVDRI
jgi:hypothetical protein